MAPLDLIEAQVSRLANAVARTTPRDVVSKIEVEDVQGIVLRGYGSLRHACYPLLRIGDALQARTWLRLMLPKLTRGRPSKADTALQIAFTHAGLAALGLHHDLLAQFSREFIEGMYTPHRSRVLGDTGESAPESWTWGGPNTQSVHVVLMLYARSPERLAELRAELKALWAEANLTGVHTLETAELAETEHFGFADGISQPSIEGYHPAASALHRVKAGEFLLGYPNEYGLYAERPRVSPSRDRAGHLAPDVEDNSLRDFGRNGTYLVFRQLRQDVPAFRKKLDEFTRNSDGTSNREARDRLAAEMVGRWPSGASLVDSPEYDDPSKASDNEFRYHLADPLGLRCPIGAHVRRANPRDALDPLPGTESSLEVNRHHRLIRRGRTYGPRLAEGKVDRQDRGLHLIVANARISRQFEFVQHSWLNDPHFNGLQNDSDPIAGAAENHDFVRPGELVGQRCSGLHRFVTVSGGAYCFLPGIRALRFLTELTP
jgi:Dyp-type peroxidase family